MAVSHESKASMQSRRSRSASTTNLPSRNFSVANASRTRRICIEERPIAILISDDHKQDTSYFSTQPKRPKWFPANDKDSTQCATVRFQRKTMQWVLEFTEAELDRAPFEPEKMAKAGRKMFDEATADSNQEYCRGTETQLRHHDNAFCIVQNELGCLIAPRRGWLPVASKKRQSHSPQLKESYVAMESSNELRDAINARASVLIDI